MPKDQEVHYSHIAEGVDPFLVGPMPADEFLAKFFPLYQPTPEEGAFSKVVEILGQKNQQAKSMYEPFCSAVQHQVPGLVLRNTSSQIDNADTEYSFSIKPDCTVYSKANENVTGTDSRVAEFFIEFTTDSPRGNRLCAAHALGLQQSHLHRTYQKAKRVRDGLCRHGLVAYDEAKRFARMNVALDARRYSKGGVSFETVPPHELRGATRRLPPQSLHTMKT
ncbi:hypothetical protein BC826DRAFT_972477 [Russula brevipes]|nr:hypothetical protein BC826DRAFT_972477 [Russula brevipes]